MKSLPENIQAEFCKLRYGNLSVAEFEKWVYENIDGIEKHLKLGDYVDLISLNFKGPDVKHKLRAPMDEFVNEFSSGQYKIDFEKYVGVEVKRLLKRFTASEGDPIQVFKIFDALRGKGFDFLNRLCELYYGFDLEELPWTDKSHLWSKKELKQYCAEMKREFETAKPHAEKIIAAIDDGKIRFKGWYVYETDEETKEMLKMKRGVPMSLNLIELVKKRWEFWQE